jgi:hypothetical protein
MVALAKPAFATYYANKAIAAVYCKICGEQIAADANGQLRRFDNYMEMKMRLSGGSFHVTNGCKRCFSQPVAPDTLTQMYNADIADMFGANTPKRYVGQTPTEVVLVTSDKRGIP